MPMTALTESFNLHKKILIYLSFYGSKPYIEA